MVSWPKAQERELEWWTNVRNFNPRNAWSHYDSHFSPFLKRKFDCVFDVGCGPVPYFCNCDVVHTRLACAIDPLMPEYQKLDKYKVFRAGFKYSIRTSMPDDVTMRTWTIPNPDAIFLLNMLDHAEVPAFTLVRAIELLRKDGLLFVFCDIGKEPDLMHPHTLGAASLHFDGLVDLYMKVEPSWKFDNDVLYYVGRKK